MARVRARQQVQVAEPLPARARVASAVAGGVMVVSAVLPWAEVSAPGGASFVVASTDRANDGWVTLLVGVAIIGFAVLSSARVWSIAAGVAALVGLAVAVENWTHMRRVVERAENTLPAPVSGAIGMGLVLTVLAALAVVGVAAWSLLADHRARST
jgi:hypothetical protein